MDGQLLYVKTNITKDNEYYTPKYVVDYFFPLGFDYDPATNKQKAEEFNIKNFDTIETDGLKKDWSKYKRIWINPPFTLKQKFLEKAIQTFNNDNNKIIYILFPIEFLTTAKFHNLNCKCKLFIPKGRIDFESGLGKPGKNPAFGSVIIKLDTENSVEYIDFKERRSTNETKNLSQHR